MMNKQALKPCPLCGGEANLVEDFILCTTCGLATCKDSAVEDWNIRPREQELLNVLGLVVHCFTEEKPHTLHMDITLDKVKELIKKYEVENE